jgi:glycosyltransferase involved in cell wall biosynthesis
MKAVLCHKDLKGGSIHGGVCAIYYYLAEILYNLGVEVVTISSWERRPSEKCEHYYIPYSGPDSYRRKVVSLLNKIDFDIVECSSWKAEVLDYARQKNHKPIIIRGDLSALCLGDMTEAELEKEILMLADYRLAVSNSCAHYLRKNFNVKIDKVILNGVDIVEFKPQYRKKEKPQLQVVWAGKPTFAKGFDMLMDLVKSAPDDLFFNIVFGNVSKDYPIEIIKGGNIRYYQNLSRREMVVLYNKSDVCLSTSRYESFGLVPLEAMACGTPVVTPQSVPSFAEYVRQGRDGFLYDGLDQVVDYIRQAKEINTKDVRVQACNFSWQRTAEETLGVYKLILSK